MTVGTVTITWTEQDIGQAGLNGTVRIVPSSALSAGGITYEPLPKLYPIVASAGQSDPIVANDSAGIQPSGAFYTFTVVIPGLPPRVFDAFVYASNGASQTLASLAPIFPPENMSAYLPLPAGQQVPGYYPAALGANGASAWTPIPGTAGAGSLPIAAAVQATSFTAVAGIFYPCSTAGGSITATLPAAPPNGTVVPIMHVVQGTTGTVKNIVTIATGPGDTFNASGGTTLPLKTLDQGALLVYAAGPKAWYSYANDLSLGQLDLRYPPLAANGVYPLDNYTGTDDQKMTAALAALFAAGGGTVLLAARAHTFASQWATTYAANVVTTVRIQGAGVAFNGAWGAPSAATVVTFTYAGAGAAMMDFQHIGTIEIAGIQFKQANTGIPFVLLTNATPDLHGNVFSGGGSGTTCATDAILLGGTGTTTGGGDTAKYNAYQGLVYGNFFDGIRRAVYFQEAANSIQVYSNTISASCGSNLFQGAPFEMLGGTTKSCSGNAIYGNCIELPNYAFAFKGQYAAGNTLGPNGLFDMGGSYIAGYYLGPNCAGNEIVDGYRTFVTAPLAMDTSNNSNNRQRNMQRGGGQYEDFHQPVHFTSNAGPPQSMYFGESMIGVETTGSQGYFRTFAAVGGHPVINFVTVAATQFADGNLVSGSNWVTSATAVFALADTGQAIGGTGVTTLTQIVLTVTATTAFARQASTAYVLGDIVRPSAANSHLYQCTTAGTSGVSAPTFPTGGGTVTDGTAVWTDLGTGITAAFMSNPATATATGVTIGLSRPGTPVTETGFARNHIISTGTAPSPAVDASAGTGATVSLAGNDLAFTLTLTTGTAPASGQLCHIAAAINYVTTGPKVSLTARNAAAAAVISAGAWLVTTTAAWQLNCAAAPPASTVMIFDVLSVQ